ncbi:MAG: hypothetical protein LUC83_04210 [Clostridiales bacterium]|nr:hypothetical protein [Clostridiales bacterium]
MKKITQSYLAFTSIAYRVLALCLFPLGILALRIAMTPFLSDPGYADYYPATWLCWIPVFLLEFLADRWLFGGICGKEMCFPICLQTSSRGLPFMRSTFVGDLLRRLIWLLIYAGVSYALTGKIGLFSAELIVYICITILLNLIRHIQSNVLCLNIIWIAVSLCSGFTATFYVLTDETPAALRSLPVLDAIAVFVSVLTLRHMMSRVESSYSDAEL